mgnify:CR=1 FL=1
MRRKYQKLFLERQKRNLSCEDMGRILGISTAYYWQIENKKRRLFYDDAIRIAHIFRLKPDDLFYEND